MGLWKKRWNMWKNEGIYYDTSFLKPALLEPSFNSSINVGFTSVSAGIWLDGVVSSSCLQSLLLLLFVVLLLLLLVLWFECELTLVAGTVIGVIWKTQQGEWCESFGRQINLPAPDPCGSHVNNLDFRRQLHCCQQSFVVVFASWLAWGRQWLVWWLLYQRWCHQ